MRPFLYLYVALFISLNFFIDEQAIFLLAMTTLPVAMYLLLTKPKQKKVRVPEQEKKNGKVSSTAIESSQ
jgi:hypothetical protein